jgi:general secretion pathway protein D
MNLKRAVGPALAFLLITTPIVAAEEQDQAHGASMPTTPLADILDAVSKKSGKKFLVGHEVRPDVVISQLRSKDIDYSSLLLVLRNNDLAAATVGDIVNIVSVRIIRQYPLPVLFENDDSIDGEEWVTRVIHLENALAPQLIPIMRPLLPQAGHMAANEPSNTILIVDRYDNVKRVTEMILRMDAATPLQPAE